jgi:glycosyltransferase involved in cell wall biosynthesis
MRFSIITITFNAERYLEETLRSVASQDFVDFEHLLWDGGSTDRTLEIARSFPHVTVYQGEDGGIADAMNKGGEKAAGEFIIHLHADDLLASPQILSIINTCLRQHPSIDWLYGQAHFIGGGGAPLRTTPYERFSLSRLRKYNFITHPAVCIRRSLFQKAQGFQTHLKYCMDYDLWLRLAEWKSPFALPKVLAYFREHSHSLSTSEPLRVADEAYEVRKSYCKTFLEKYRSWRTWKKRKNVCGHLKN